MGFIWWIPILIASLAGVISFMATNSADDVYVSQALFIVSEEATAPPEAFGDLARNSVVLRETIRQLRIPTDEAGLANAIEIDVRGRLVEVRARATDPIGARVLLETLVSQLVFLTPDLLGEQGPTIVQQPQAPTAAEGNGAARNAGLAVAGGLLVGILIALLLARRELHLQTARHFELLSGWPAIGVIPKSRRGDQGSLVRAGPEYTDLAAAVSRAGHDSRVRTVLVTGGRSGQGASTVAASLAAALAEQGQSVTLIDADLHTPTIHRLFGLGNNRGLADVLEAAHNPARIAPENTQLNVPQTVVLSAAGTDLRVLTSGLLPSNPARLLRPEIFASVLEDFAAESDLVIVDAPPVSEHPETALLATLCDSVLLAVASESMLSGSMDEVVEALDRPDTPVPGIVVVKAGKEARAEFEQRHEATRILQELAAEMEWEAQSEALPDPEPRATAPATTDPDALPDSLAPARTLLEPGPSDPAPRPSAGRREESRFSQPLPEAAQTEADRDPQRPPPAATQSAEPMPAEPTRTLKIPAVPELTGRPIPPLRTESAPTEPAQPETLISEPEPSGSAAVTPSATVTPSADMPPSAALKPMPPEEIPPWLRPRPRAQRRSTSPEPPPTIKEPLAPPERVLPERADAEWQREAGPDDANDPERPDDPADADDQPTENSSPITEPGDQTPSDSEPEGDSHGLPPPS